MNSNLPNNNLIGKRERLLRIALIPQAVILMVSILWINFSPDSNVFKYLKPNILHVSYGILAGVFLAVSGYGFYRLSKKIKNLSATVELFENMLSPTFSCLQITDIIFLSFISGFCEEVLFRGLLLPACGIIVSSIAFGLLHLPGFKYWIYAAWAILSGILLGFLFISTGSLWTPISAHIVNNIIGFLMLKKVKKSAI